LEIDTAKSADSAFVVLLHHSSRFEDKRRGGRAFVISHETGCPLRDDSRH
jgi:hypothetical protein